MILITGATGMVGREVVKRLYARGVPLRAMVHHPEKAGAIAGHDMEIVHGEYEDPASLDAAVVGIERIFLLSPSGPRQVDWERNMADAAKRAGVTHIVKLSVFGASPFSPINLSRWHWESERHIEETGLAFTHLRPNFFMQDVLVFAETIMSQGRFYGAMDGGRMSVIDVRDAASVAVAALIQDGHEGRTYELTGPKALTYYDMAARLRETLGLPVEYVDLPPDAFTARMRETGMPDWLAADFLNYQRFFAVGRGVTVTDWVRRLTGNASISFDQFARDYAEVILNPALVAA